MPILTLVPSNTPTYNGFPLAATTARSLPLGLAELDGVEKTALPIPGCV